MEKLKEEFEKFLEEHKVSKERLKAVLDATEDGDWMAAEDLVAMIREML